MVDTIFQVYHRYTLIHTDPSSSACCHGAWQQAILQIRNLQPDAWNLELDIFGVSQFHCKNLPHRVIRILQEEQGGTIPLRKGETMAYRLGDYVVYGEIYNHNNYSTHGIIALRGKTEEDAHVIRIELTGNCDPDLRGIAFRFWPDEEWTKINGKIFKKREHKGFADFQIGPTGTMTAEGWARFVPCSVKEYLRRCELGEAPPTPWKRRLYLEWFSQNGRVVIELAGFKIEQCIRMGKGMEDEGDWEPLPNLALHPDEERARLRELGIEEDPDAQKPGLQITAIHLDGDNVEITDMSPPPELAGEGEDSSEGGIFSNGDSYESIPSALQKELDAQTASIDRAIGASSADDDDDDIIAEMKLMDACIDHAETKPLQAFLGDLSKLARASRPCVQ